MNLPISFTCAACGSCQNLLIVQLLAISSTQWKLAYEYLRRASPRACLLSSHTTTILHASNAKTFKTSTQKNRT
ncbi:hypothetical protein L207DRAFT_512982 [Hyaloscypha variabilis F]|uniref:Uncharacterized protein n=1 Tax=Hyaloscypha variabilis (strain UAMH 11265 / GT02V1 / F) TaxID=1149755 RepID=A0A2J6RNF3_HYAVF|nr:hypothetical protein L207DRAFT_512982 [Hyaloscypha variabilis F]